MDRRTLVILLLFLFIVTFCSISPSIVSAATYDFSVGMSTEYTILPGSLVTINMNLVNTGDKSIVFGPDYSNSLTSPSDLGGAFMSGGFSNAGDWTLSSNNFYFGPTSSNPTFPQTVYDFKNQFANLTLDPGETFSFTFGNFVAPSNQPLGSDGMAKGLYFELWFSDTLYGGINLCRTGCNSFWAGYGDPSITFTLGSVAQNSAMSYFDANVYDLTSFSGPDCSPVVPIDCNAGGGVAPVPEPSTMFLLGSGLAGLVGYGRKRMKR